jgi:hypothetical protein
MFVGWAKLSSSWIGSGGELPELSMQLAKAKEQRDASQLGVDPSRVLLSSTLFLSLGRGKAYGSRH